MSVWTKIAAFMHHLQTHVKLGLEIHLFKRFLGECISERIVKRHCFLFLEALFYYFKLLWRLSLCLSYLKLICFLLSKVYLIMSEQHYGLYDIVVLV